MGKLRSYIEYTLSIVRCLKPFQILLFLLLFLFFCVCWETLFFPHVRFCSWSAILSAAMKLEWLLLVRADGASVFLSFYVSCRQMKATAIKTSQCNKPPCGWCMPHGVFCLLPVTLGNHSVSFCHPVPLYKATFSCLKSSVFLGKKEAFLLGEVTNVIRESN